MGKKRIRTSQTSKGQRRPIDPRWRKEQRREYTGSTMELLNKLRAHVSGKPTWVTIPNPDKQQTNKPFIRVRGRDYFTKAGGKTNASTSN
jgi:hypothetical protein